MTCGSFMRTGDIGLRQQPPCGIIHVDFGVQSPDAMDQLELRTSVPVNLSPGNSSSRQRRLALFAIGNRLQVLRRKRTHKIEAMKQLLVGVPAPCARSGSRDPWCAP